MLAAMVEIISDVWRGRGMFARPGPAGSHFLIICSVIYAGSMVLRYVLTMTYRLEMRWFGGTIPILFHFVLAGFLYTWGSSIYNATHSKSRDG